MSDARILSALLRGSSVQPNEPELRNAEFPARAVMGLNALGGSVGYPDIAQRTGQTAETVLAGLGFALPGVGGNISADRAIAKQLLEMHPFEATHEPGMSARFNEWWPNTAGTRIFSPAKNMAEGLPSPITKPGEIIQPPQWQNPFYEMHDGGPPMGADEQRYLDALMAQRARGGLKAVP